MQSVLKKLKNSEHLSPHEVSSSLDMMLSGNAPPEVIGAFLMGLSQKGETAQEIAAAASYLRKQAHIITAPKNAVDCCGTGGDVSGTYNISTAVALICAACGVPMAKHGNRSASSKSGAADVLEALGVNLKVPPQKLEEALKAFNFAFLMAPRHHQVLKPVVPIRKNLGFPTLFNLLGPLANPANAPIQLLGVYDQKWLRPMAEALKLLGSIRAWVVHGRDGLDEITLTTETDIISLNQDGSIEEIVLSPTDIGLSLCDPKSLKGGSAEENAAALMDVLNSAPSAYAEVACLNAAAVLLLHNSCCTLQEGFKQAKEALQSGKALQNFSAYRDFVRG